MVKNLPVNAGAPGDMGSIPGSEKPPGGGMATHSSILASNIPWAEEGYSPWGHRVRHNRATKHAGTHMAAVTRVS